MPQKKPFVTLAQARAIAAEIPTPFHLYDEAGIRANARKVNAAFSWNKGFKEYFAVKATPNPYILKILQEEGCGVDCSSYTELLMGEACGFTGSDIMFSSNETPAQDMQKAYELGFDLNTPYKHQKILAGETFDIEAEDAECHWTNHFDAAAGRVDIAIDIDYHETGEHFKESFSEYSYPLDLVTSLLEKYGFTVAKVADGEDFGLVRPDSPRWIITAVKQYTQEGKE